MIKETRLRLTIFRTNRYLFAQIIDASGKTVLGISDKKLVKKPKQTKSQGAKDFGLEFAKLALEKKVKRVYFDRGQHLYHGRVQAFAEGAREGGLEF